MSDTAEQVVEEVNVEEEAPQKKKEVDQEKYH